MPPSAALVAQDVSKRYGRTLALEGVTLALTPGEVHGLVGHNGAGKSTLLRLLAGAERPDVGAIMIGGRRQSFAGPADAIAAGVASVYQELSLVDQLTVAQSIFLGRERTRGGRLAKGEMEAAAARLCADFGLDVDPTAKVGELAVARRQMVEIVAALQRNARSRLLDEPTTALVADRIEQLRATVRRLAREEGLAVLLVDHKLDEVFAVADRVTALANGAVVLAGAVGEVVQADVVRAIVGEVVQADVVRAIVGEATPVEATTGSPAAGAARPAGGAGEPRLRVEGLATERLRGVSLVAGAGQILGLYGLVGSGRSRFLRTLVGLERPTAGVVTLEGRRYRPRGPRDAIAAGVAYLSEERKADGFVPAMTPPANVTLPVLDRFATGGVLRRGAMAGAALDELRRVRIRGRLDGPIRDLSGGNQQKTLFARATLERPRLLLLDQPTKGVDIGAKAEIHAIVRDLAASQGIAVVVVSDEEDEILGLADEIAVFRDGRCDGTTYPRGTIDARRLRQLAWTGVGADAVEEAAGA